jgi:hypothetical protein
VSRSVRRRIAQAAVIALALVMTAFLATGCTKSSSKNGNIASSAKGVDYVPRSAFMYFVFDLNFDGDAWKQANDLLKKFPKYDDSKKKLIEDISKEGDVDYKTDIKPWLGDQAGFAVLKVSAKKGAKNDAFFAWADLKDETKAKAFLKRETEQTSTTSYKGYDLITAKAKHPDTDDSNEPTVYAIKDNTLLFANKASALRAAIRASKGKSIKDTPGYDDTVSEVEDDSLGSMYVSGVAVRKLLDQAVAQGGAQTKSVRGLLDVPQLRSLQGFAMGLSPEDEGFDLLGHVNYDEEKLGNESLGENFDPTLVKGLPGTTVFAVGGDNLGKGVDKLIESLKDSNPAVSQQMAQVEAMLGVSLDDVIEVLSGQFSFALLGKAQGKPTLPVAGVIFEAKDEAKSAKVLEKLLGASTLATGSPATKKSIAGVQAIQAKSGSTVVTAATFDKKMVVGTSEQFLSDIKTGTSTLGDAAGFKQVWDDAGAPDEVGGLFYADVHGLVSAFKSSSFGAMLAGDKAKSAEDVPISDVLGWVVNDKHSQTIEFFARVDSDAA